MKELGLSIDQAQDELTKNSGLKGTAGIGTEDFRDILTAVESGNMRAKIAVEAYLDGIRKYIGFLWHSNGRIDCIVLSGGIGEKAIMQGRESLKIWNIVWGTKIDLQKNKEILGTRGSYPLDYSIESRAKVFVIPTNEESVVAIFYEEKLLKRGKTQPGRDALQAKVAKDKLALAFAKLFLLPY